MENIRELSQLIARHGRVGQIETSVAGLSLMVSYAPTEPIHNIYEPAFALIANGSKRTVLGDRVFDYGSGQYIVVSVELPIAVCAFRRAPPRPVATAPTKNIENNPMQSSRRPPQPTV